MTVRLTVARLSAGAIMAASVVAIPAAANPSDPLCIMGPDAYCAEYATILFGTGPGAQGKCMVWAWNLYNGEFCNGPLVDGSLKAIKE